MSARETSAQSRDKSALGIMLFHAIAFPKETCGTALPDENLHDWQLRSVLSALTAAGYRILGPDELDAVTVEKCAEVAETMASDWRENHLPRQASVIDDVSTAIRALSRATSQEDTQ